MTITLPIYVRTVDAADGQGRAYEVRPLFHSAPALRDPSLERALSLLATDLRKHLRDLGRRDRHDELAEWAFCPEIDSRRVDLVIELRRSRAQGGSWSPRSRCWGGGWRSRRACPAPGSRSRAANGSKPAPSRS